jgi:hypothetical protein
LDGVAVNETSRGAVPVDGDAAGFWATGTTPMTIQVLPETGLPNGMDPVVQVPVK